MSTEHPDDGAMAAVSLLPSSELVNGLLKWPADLRVNLANLLLDSVRAGFSSLQEAEDHNREVIRQRTRQVVSGEVPLLEWRESLDQVEQSFRSKFPQ